MGHRPLWAHGACRATSVDQNHERGLHGKQRTKEQLEQQKRSEIVVEGKTTQESRKKEGIVPPTQIALLLTGGWLR